ncbi:anti-sigma regulatory factor [Streptomyces sp. JB150]|uniref:anti-sigma regulatory factor n=1 Tax=Streptomyces sp. JB150 TaxID=2714844 RepID=UPI00140D5668|nr:anti-sigma regulatory factor [Streptomyces sp. JB150]QIJ60766.1 anti-sigma regulatory factor [Streptomyces sp. JB150]
MTPAGRLTAQSTPPIGSDAGPAGVRQRVRQAALVPGCGPVRRTEPVTAAGEPARDTLVHGGGGRMERTARNGTPRPGPRLSFTDDGPGSRDTAPASTDRRTTVTVTAWSCALPSPRAGAA